MRDAGRRWAFILLAAAAVFVASAAAVSLAGVPLFERRFYEALTTAIPNALVFRRVTRLGSVSVLLPVSVFLVVLLPRQFLRRWWVWVVVMIAVTTLEGLGKVSIGRSRPGGMRLGFPSGHTAAAAAFYPMACYFFEDVVRRWVKYALYALAAVLIVLVALSRMVLRVHWPLALVTPTPVQEPPVIEPTLPAKRLPDTVTPEAATKPDPSPGSIFTVTVKGMMRWPLLLMPAHAALLSGALGVTVTV